MVNSQNLPISYYLGYNPDIYIDKSDHPSDVEIYNHLRTSFKPQADLSKFSITSKDQASLYNSEGFNIDDRGSDDSTHLMDFHIDWPLPEKFSVLELAEGLFRLRSHKWENNYELYISCSHEIYSSHNGKTIINLSFDHGS